MSINKALLALALGLALVACTNKQQAADSAADAANSAADAQQAADNAAATGAAPAADAAHRRSRRRGGRTSRSMRCWGRRGCCPTSTW
mgnify:CR=1 FL=1